MKIKDGFVLRSIVGQYIVIGEGISQVNFNKMITMNESAAYLWQQVQNMPSFTEQTLADLLLREYEVSPEQAAADAHQTADHWREAGIVEP